MNKTYFPLDILGPHVSHFIYKNNMQGSDFNMSTLINTLKYRFVAALVVYILLKL